MARIAIRLPEKLLVKVDRLAARRERAAPGSSVTRSDVVREALYKMVGGKS